MARKATRTGAKSKTQSKARTPKESKPKAPRYTKQTALNLTSEEFNKLSRNELANATQALVDVANKRIKRLEKAGLTDSYAYKAITKDGKLTTKGKNLNELRREYSRIKDFLSMKTSTVSGTKAVKKQFNELIGVKKGQDYNPTPEQKTRFNELFKALLRSDPHAMDGYLKYKTMGKIADEVTKDDFVFEKSLEKLEQFTMEKYEQGQEESLGDFGDVFSFDGN